MTASKPTTPMEDCEATVVADGFGLSRIGQIAMTVRDLPRAVAFYRDVLGMRFLFEAPPAMAFFDCGGIRLMLSLPERARSTTSVRLDHLLHGPRHPGRQRRCCGARGVTFEAAAARGRAPAACGSVDGVPPRPRRNLLAIMSEVTASRRLGLHEPESLRRFQAHVSATDPCRSCGAALRGRGGSPPAGRAGAPRPARSASRA